jgi:D-tyrosyl-tRNA(Tyr) deacylase
LRALLQRVVRSAVHINNMPSAEIGTGLCILLGVGKDDTTDDVEYVAEKCVNLRIFEDDQGKMNRSLLDIQGKALIISQFTLYGDTRKGRRPGFSDAAPPEQANRLYQLFVDAVQRKGIPVQTGEFGQHMHVEIHNNGPVTLMVESQN